VLAQRLTVKRQDERALTQSLIVITQGETVLTQSLVVRSQNERVPTQSLVVKTYHERKLNQSLIVKRQNERVLTQSLVVKVEVQEVLVIYLSNLDDGFIVQVLLQALDLAAHQLVGLVRIFAAILQQVVCVLHLPARLLCSESGDRLCVVFDVAAWLLYRQVDGLVCIHDMQTDCWPCMHPEQHIHFLNTLYVFFIFLQEYQAVGRQTECELS